MEHVHLIGIGGTGLSAIARVLLESGYTVTGSDRVLSPLAEDLRSAGVRVDIGHAPENIRGADVVVRSSAVADDNPEVQAARSVGIPVFKRAEFLGRLMEGKLGIAVAGSHGKTTTTAMIAWMLVRMGQDPSYIVGGVLKNLQNNAHAGKGRFFVIEADEYDRMFLGLTPQLIAVTNVEHDHPDCYPTPQDYYAVFDKFAGLLPADGILLGCKDDAGAASLVAAAAKRGQQAFSYGLDGGSDYQAVNLKNQANRGFAFTVVHKGQELAQVSLQVPGEHNVRNALAALVASDRLHLDVRQAAQALSEYQGSGRRFDVLGNAGGVVIIDDYAHHPTKIRATLAAARLRYPNARIWAVWQPHTYSRTQVFFDQFVHAFADADQVIVTEVYAAREANNGFSAREVVQAMSQPAHFIPALADVTQYLLDNLQPGDVLLVLSAGDADQIGRQVLARLQERKHSHE